MKRIFMMTVLLMLCFLGGCAAQAQPPADPPKEEVETPIPEPAPYDGPENPLTGLPVESDISMNRPFAISINNLKAAQPQRGVSGADIIYEVLAEGGITRMIAVFQDPTDIGVIGSIRSARPYFLDITEGLDAVFIHAGGSETAYSAMSRQNISHIDGVRGDGSMFYRDSYRKSHNGYEHSLMTSSELIAEKAGNYGFSLQHKGGYRFPLEFSDEITLQGSEAANEISVKFSTYKTGTFLYDQESGLYQVSQYGSAYTDGNTEKQVSVKNVLILYAASKTLDSEGRLSVTLTGSGSGYFACGGASVPIIWEKATATDPFTYKLANGSELVFARGVTYVCIVPSSGMNADPSPVQFQ